MTGKSRKPFPYSRRHCLHRPVGFTDNRRDVALTAAREHNPVVGDTDDARMATKRLGNQAVKRSNGSAVGVGRGEHVGHDNAARHQTACDGGHSVSGYERSAGCTQGAVSVTVFAVDTAVAWLPVDVEEDPVKATAVVVPLHTLSPTTTLVQND